MAIFTYTANKDPHDQTRILRLRDGALIVEMGQAADFYPEEVASLSSRVILTPGATGPVAEPGQTQYIRLQDLLDVPRPLADNDVLAFDFANDDFKAIQVATSAQLAAKQDAATAATDAELTAHANTFGRGGHIPTTGLTTADVIFTIFDAKADLLVASAADAAGRLAVGSNAQVLTADSTQPLGLKWATPDVTQAELDVVAAASVIIAPTTTARNTMQPTAVGVIPLILRQATGESGATAIQQWSSPTGTVMAQVTGNGAIQGVFAYDRAGTRPYISLELGTTTIGAVARSATQVPWTLKAVAAQTGNLLEAQDSAGTILAKFSSTGHLGIGVGAGSVAAGMMFVQADATGTTPAIFRGMTGQTADLQQWRDVTDAVLAKVDNTGFITAKGYQTNLVGAEGFSRVYLDPSIFGIDFGGGTLTRDVRLSRTAAGVITQQGIGAATATTSVTKMVAAQSANSVEVQDSAGTVVTAVTSTGRLGIGTGAPVNWLDIQASSAASVVGSILNSGTGRTEFYLMGSGGTSWRIQNTGSPNWQFQLQDGQNNATKILVSRGGSGMLALQPNSGAVGVGNSSPGARLHVTGETTTVPVLIARGAASQTADLFQAQDSTGSVLSRFDSIGGLHIPVLQVGASTTAGWVLTADSSGNATWAAAPGGGGSTITLQDEGVALGTQRATWNLIGAGVTTADDAVNARTNITIPGADLSPTVILAPAASTRNVIQPTVATVVSLVSKGFASQTANLFEAQSSAGAVLSKITAAGVNDAISYTQAGTALASTHLSDSSALARLASPVFTGDPQAPTPATADNDVSIATTAFVKAQGYLTTVDHSPDVILAPTSSTRNLIQPTGAAFVPLVVRAFASQTADLQQWQNSAGTTLSRVAPDGSNYIPATLSHTGTLLGFYNVTPVVRPATRTMSNWTLGANALRTIDRNAYTPDQLFDFVMTMASDLQAVGLFA